MKKNKKINWELEGEKDVGDVVLCDICNTDYTKSKKSGGFIFGSYAYCPECAGRRLENIIGHNEERHIKAYCPEEISFADFVRKYRGKDSKIRFFVEKKK